MSAINVENLSFSYGSNQILNDICVEINCKQIYALLGPSGGGKTTLLRLILGTIKAKNGSIRVLDGRSALEANCPLSYMPQDCALCPQFTVNQTMNYFKNIYRLPEPDFKKRYQKLRQFLHLPSGQLLVNQLSGGTQRRLSFAVAMINMPAIVILDEPTVGVDPIIRQKMWTFLAEECRRGLTAVIVTHYVEEAINSDRVALMRNGRILAEDCPKRLMQNVGTNSLEEVFLQLCLIDDKSMKDYGISSYKTQNSSPMIENDFNNDSFDNMKYESNYQKLVINSWILLILIHKNIVKLSKLSLSTLIILLPALQAFIFCVLYSKDVIQLRTAVFNEELGDNYGTRLLSLLVGVDRHIIQPINYSSISEAINSVKSTESIAAIYIRKNFSDAIDDRITDGLNADNQTITESTIGVYIDNSIIMYSNGIIDSLTQTLVGLLTQIYSENNKWFHGIAISVEKTQNSKDLLINNYYLPAFYLYVLYIARIINSSLLLTHEQKDGLFERSLISGVSREIVFLSHFITSCLMSIIEIICLYITGFILFNSINNSSLLLLFSYLFLEQINAISIGLLISALVDRDIVCIILVWFITLPQMFCCGLFWPLEALNPTFKFVFYYVSTFAIPVETMRNLVLRGWDLTHPSIQYGFMWSTVLNTICITIAMIIFKRK